MNEIKGLVTPLTRGVIWLTRKESDSSNPVYKDLDYLLDGLLTANIRKNDGIKSSRLIVGKNYGELLYVFVVNEVNKSELRSFISLIKTGLVTENDIIVIDELNSLSSLKEELKEISNHLKIIQ